MSSFSALLKCYLPSTTPPIFIGSLEACLRVDHQQKYLGQNFRITHVSPVTVQGRDVDEGQRAALFFPLPIKIQSNVSSTLDVSKSSSKIPVHPEAS